MTDPAQVLQVLRDVLIEHMDSPDTLPSYRVSRVLQLGKTTGRIMSDEDIASGADIPGRLLLTMRDGSELRLTLEDANRRGRRR